MKCQRCGERIEWVPDWRPDVGAYVALGTEEVDCGGKGHVPPVGRHRAEPHG